jgi:NAD+ synthase (glutamine-hydrolysing)
MIVCNGEILPQAQKFDVNVVQVISATYDLDDVRSYRASLPSFGMFKLQITRRHETDCLS